MNKKTYGEINEIKIENLETNMIDKCRACESQVNLYNLFDNPDNLYNKFALCTSLEVMLDDELPKSICKECLNELNIAYIFRTKCEQTNFKLLALLNQVKSVDLKINEDTEFLCEFKDEFSVSEDGDIISNEDNNEIIENVSGYINIDKIYDSKLSTNIVHNDIFENILVKEPLICNTCGFEYKNIMLSESIINGSKNFKQIFECIKCNLKSKEAAKNVPKLKKIEYKCDICSKNFSHSSNLKRHCKTIHGPKKLIVESVSSKSLTLESTLKLQSRLRSSIKSKTSRNELINSTINTENNTTETVSKSSDNRKRSTYQPIICQYCGKKSFNMSNHLRHERIHTGETPYECAVCSKKFKVEASLKNHQTLHTGEKSHECSVCNKKFRLKKSLSFHLLVHTGEKPYKCDICGKMCRLTQHLKSHKLTHSGERKYECGLCGMTFRQMPHLRQHNYTHTGEKPHKCLYCDKAFAMRYNLTVHLRTHTGDTPYQCPICLKKFNDSKGLKRHKFVHIKNAIAVHPNTT